MGVDVSNRNRVRPGVPTGGEFACEQRDENEDLVVTEEAPEPEVWTPPPLLVPSWAYADAEARIARANKRLENAKIEERFEAIWGEPIVDVHVEDDGTETRVEYRELSLNHPKLCYKGWEFVATLDELGDGRGMIVKAKPGVELDGFAPEAAWCDHCQTHRTRGKTYLVRGEDGTLKQVGSSCIENFLGVKPSLFTLGEDPIGEDASEEWSHGYNPGYSVQDPRLAIAVALVASDMGKNFRPSSFEEGSTSAIVKDTLWGRGGSTEMKNARAAMHARAEEILASGEVDEVIRAVRSMTGDGDYVTNMHKLFGAEGDLYPVKMGQIGLLASAVKQLGVARVRDAKVKFPREPKGFVADEGAKLADLRTSDGKPGLRVMIDKVTGFESDYGYPPKWIDRIIMRDENGRTLKLDTTAQLPEMKEGEVWRIVKGSVKGHSNYQGTDQTVIKLAKFEAEEPEVPAAE